MSHSQFHCTGRVYLDLHGLIFETSICYWQDQPGSHSQLRCLYLGTLSKQQPGTSPIPSGEEALAPSTVCPAGGPELPMAGATGAGAPLERSLV
jgi:hypothetical protein